MQAYLAAGIIIGFLLLLSVPVMLFVRSALAARNAFKEAGGNHGLRYQDSTRKLPILDAGQADWYQHVPEKNLLFSNVLEGTLDGTAISFVDVGVGGHHRGAPEGRMCFCLLSDSLLPEITITSPRQSSIAVMRNAETRGKLLIEPTMAVSYDPSAWTEGQVRRLLDFELPESFRGEPSFRVYTQGRFLIVKDERRKIPPGDWVRDALQFCSEFGQRLPAALSEKM